MRSSYIPLLLEVQKAGKEILDSGKNPIITCEDTRYLELLKKGYSPARAYSVRAATYANEEYKDKSKLDIINDILFYANLIVAAGYNPKVTCINRDHQNMVEKSLEERNQRIRRSFL